MSRVKMQKGRQGEFLNRVGRISGFDWKRVANICGVCERTVRDWRREKYQMSYESLVKLHEILNVPLPRNIKALSDYWYTQRAGRIGAIRRYEIYGNPGTPEGRSRGGKTTQRKFMADPEYAREAGFKIRKTIVQPKRSALLAELIGIVLGDGSISEHQVTISMNSKTDGPYGNSIKKLISDLFGISSTLKIRKKNTLQVTVSGKNLVEFLLKCGLKRGDKVVQQVDVPKWIFEDKKFIKGCLRGLIDTDGGIYYHNHTTKGIKYRHIGLCFTSRSLPLLKSAEKMFLAVGIHAKSNGKERLYLYGNEKVGRYLDLVGTSNFKHLTRYRSYKGSKGQRI